MKLLTVLCCIFIAGVIGQDDKDNSNDVRSNPTAHYYPIHSAPGSIAPAPYYPGYPAPAPVSPSDPAPYYPNYPIPSIPSPYYPDHYYPDDTATPSRETDLSSSRKPCGSQNLGDYKGGCDPSVPVIVMPKGRPIMERVLDWFKCNTEDCRSKEDLVVTGLGTLPTIAGGY